MKTKKTMLVLILILILTNVCLLSGCSFDKIMERLTRNAWDRKDTYFETEYFRGYVDEDGAVVLRALTEAGIELEELVIPSVIEDVKLGSSEVNGKPVDRIGARLGREVYFTDSKAKKVFFPPNAKPMRASPMFRPKKFILVSYDLNKDQTNQASDTKCRIPKEAYANYKKDGEGYPTANISYLNNYDETLNGGIWWIDDLEEGDKIKTVPPMPKREGYRFLGWYYETDCLNKFDFSSYIKEEYSDHLALYANWIKN